MFVVSSLKDAGISLYGLIVMFPAAAAAPGAENPTADPPVTAIGFFSGFVFSNQTFQLVPNLAWDVIFTFSAIFYIIAWWKDGTASIEGESIGGVEMRTKLLDDKY